MTWHTTTYRLPADAKRGTCQRPITTKYPEQCPEQATCGFTSIYDTTGDYRYTERCDACSVILAERTGIKPAGLREALIFPIPATADTAKCASCYCLVRWIHTAKGNRMPADPNGISHFISCPGSSAHRRRA